MNSPQYPPADSHSDWVLSKLIVMDRVQISVILLKLEIEPLAFLRLFMQICQLFGLPKMYFISRKVLSRVEFEL